MFVIYATNVFVSNFPLITDATIVTFMPKYLHSQYEEITPSGIRRSKSMQNMEDFDTTQPQGWGWNLTR